MTDSILTDDGGKPYFLCIAARRIATVQMWAPGARQQVSRTVSQHQLEAMQMLIAERLLELKQQAVEELGS